jgi:ABC superfamily ATP binding cassette transporter, ABC/membrane protein
VWIANKAYVVVGVISDSGLDASIMNAVVMRETDAVAVGATNAVTAEIRTRPGAAQLVAQQAPIALDPYTGENAHVDAPEDPKTMRQSVESNVRTMLVTLTAVSLLAAVLMLTNSTATAVSRRSGEFGLRRAMGARRWQIAALVTAESAIVGLIGGVIGTFTAVVVIISTVLVRHWQPVLDLRLLPVGIIGGMVVGLVGCLLAVRRAAGVSPADALRQ